MKSKLINSSLVEPADFDHLGSHDDEGFGAGGSGDGRQRVVMGSSGQNAVLPRGYAQTESSTSQALQVCLHFNFYLSGLFAVMESVVLAQKLSKYELNVFGQVLTPLTFGVWAASEIFRLWFGYTGNLQEKLPQISVFFLLSVFPQLPCLLYLMQFQEFQLPFEKVFSAIVLTMTLVELIITYRTVRYLVQKQTRSYVRLVEEHDSDY